MATSTVMGAPRFILDFVDVPYPSSGVAGNGSYNTNLKTLIDAKLPAGYVFAGIAGWATNSGSLYITNMRYSDSVYSFQVKNATSSAVTPTGARVEFFAVKNM